MQPSPAGEKRLTLLLISQDSKLAERCLAVLKAAGYEADVETVRTPEGAHGPLKDKAYDAILEEPASGKNGVDDLAPERVEAPLIRLGAQPDFREAAELFSKGVVDFVSTQELMRLPWAVSRAIELKKLSVAAQRAEQAQHLAEECYRMLFERNLAGVYRATMDGQLLELNDTCARMFGYASSAQARSRNLREMLFSPEDYEKLMGGLRESGVVNNLELSFRRRDGEAVWALVNAGLVESGGQDPPRVEGTLIDITERKRAEEALRQSEQRFRTLFEKSSDAISLVNAEGKVLYSSHAISRIFGYSLDERVGKNVFEFVHPKDLAETLTLFRKLLETPSASVTTQIRYRHRDGSWRWIEAHGTNLLEDPGVQAVVVNYHDVTERRQLLEQLFQSQKMEAVGRLAGGIAHDFNNLLTAILGYSDLVAEKLPQESVLRHYALEIKKAGERAGGLTRQLLAFSRLQVMSAQVLDLNAVIADMSKMLRRLIGEDIAFAMLPEVRLGRVKADPSHIEQVILNLAVNARDAMPRGGELTLRTSNVKIEEGFVVEGVKASPGNYVLLEVSDTGCGMDRETRARAFEPFFTTKEKGKGTGLGLSTVYGIVKQNNGYIWVSSEVGRGTTFRIYLPAVSEALTELRPPEATASEHRGHETILLVEDEASVRQLVRQVLESKGYHVLQASRGEEALATAEKHAGTIHLVLTDVVMPRMNGQELGHRIRALHPETKVLFMTGYAGNRIGSTEVLEENAQFIQKPFSAEALSQKIRSILDTL